MRDICLIKRRIERTVLDQIIANTVWWKSTNTQTIVHFLVFILYLHNGVHKGVVTCLIFACCHLRENQILEFVITLQGGLETMLIKYFH